MSPPSSSHPPQPQPHQQPSLPQAMTYLVVKTTSEDKQHFAKHFPRRMIVILSSGQIITFATALVTAIILFVHDRYGISDTGFGIWCGVFFGIAGTLGLLAAWKQTACSIVAFMMTSILSALFTVPLIIFSVVGIYNPRFFHIGDARKQESVAIAFNVVLFLCGLVELMLAVACSVICCRACCCCRSTPGEVVQARGGAASSSQQQQQMEEEEEEGYYNMAVVHDPPPKYDDIFADRVN